MLFHGVHVPLHSPILNVKKTKELIFDVSKSAPYHEPLTIQGCDAEICIQFKYIGVIYIVQAIMG